jgi:hypothetical protein
VLGFVALLLAQQGTLLGIEPTSDSTCPTPVQVTSAIAARLPGVLVESGRARSLGALRLRVQRTPEGQPAFALIDVQDGVRLYRILESPATLGPSDCMSLAETTALIVDRFLQELDARALRPTDRGALGSPAGETAGLSASASATPLPGAWRLAVVGASRPIDAATPMFGAALRLARARSSPLGLVLGGAIGLSLRQELEIPTRLGGGRSGLRLLPIDLSAHLRLPLGRGTLEPGVVAALDVLFVDDRPQEGGLAREIRLGPWAGPSLAYALPIARALYARGVAGVGFHAIRYEAARADQADAAFSTGRVHAALEVELGIAFY